MKKVLSDLDKLKLGGVRTVVTVLFVDIRNFTQISENLPPQDVTNILNDYFSVLEPIVAKYNGIINKYMADGVLAVFGEPIKEEDHALNAIKCGIEIQDKVKIFREQLLKDGKPKIDIGIGINSGDVFAGNIGTEERLEYTVIGDNVNLAYRIESYNQLLKTQFLISQYTYEYVKVCDELDATSLTTSTTIAELIALLPAMKNGLASAMVDFGVFNSTPMGLCQVVVYETATDTYSVAIKGALNTLTGTGLAPTDTLGDLT